MLYRCCDIFYSSLISFGNFLQSFLLLALRLYWGASFFHTGLGKLSQIDPIISFFQKLDIPFPTISAYLAASTECVGGALPFIGFCLAFSDPTAYLYDGRSLPNCAY